MLGPGPPSLGKQLDWRGEGSWLPTRDRACQVLGCSVANPQILGGSAEEDAVPGPRQGLWEWESPQARRRGLFIYF